MPSNTLVAWVHKIQTFLPMYASLCFLVACNWSRSTLVTLTSALSPFFVVVIAMLV